MFNKAVSLPADKGLNLLDSVNQILFKSHPPATEDLVQYYRARALVLKSINARRAIFALDTLQVLLNKHKELPGFKRYYAQALTTKADIYISTQKSEEGLKALDEAKKIIDEYFRDSCEKGSLIEPLASMLFRQSNYPQAASYYLELLANAHYCDSSSFERYYYSYSGSMNAGVCYRAAGMYDSAHYYFKKALELIDRNQARFPDKASYFLLSEGVVNRHLGYTKMVLKQYQEAEALLLFAIKNTEKEYPEFARNGRLELAELYLESMQPDKAKEILDTLDAMPPIRVDKQEYDLSLNKLKKGYYKQKGDEKRTLQYHDTISALRDTQSVQHGRNLNRDFAVEINANEQKRMNDQQKIENERTSFHVMAVAFLAVIVVLVIALIWSNLNRASKHTRTLKILNQEILMQKQDVLDAYVSLEKSHATNQALLRTAAHDLKNPLSAISMLVSSLTNRVQDNDVQETFGLIDDACKQSVVLISDMIMADAVKFTRIQKDMNDIWRLLEYCVEMMKPRAEEKHQQLLLQGQSTEVLINKDKMWRVITNIINNAIKFSPDSGVIHITLEKLENAVLFSVKDNGIGIPLKLQEKIFESTAEAQRTGTAGEESHGLGLGICKKIVEEHNGKLWVESKEGAGSTFFVKLPSGN